jgi:hypothetical protein
MASVARLTGAAPGPPRAQRPTWWDTILALTRELHDPAPPRPLAARFLSLAVLARRAHRRVLTVDHACSRCRVRPGNRKPGRIWLGDLRRGGRVLTATVTSA